MGPSYWRSNAEDEAMQDEHGFLWRALLDTVDVDLTGARVLDIGCNRGGLLRMVADRWPIAEGAGYDPAAGAVEDAERLAGSRPLRFATAETVPAGWEGFEVAFSHEVLYLLEDLGAHAEDVHGALAPGGVYYAVTGVHRDSPLMAAWHAEHSASLGLPPLRAIDEVLAVFRSAGFDAAVGRLPVGFVPLAAHGHHDGGRMLDWLAYYHEQKLVLRFER
jgi:SAM-dependent methyltransferase